MNVNELDSKIIEVLSNCDEAGSNVLEEGRANSLIDEGKIIKILKNNEELNHYIYNGYDTLRGTGDINFILDYELYPYNIKTYDDNENGTNDNIFSKLGLLYSFTDIDIRGIPKALSWKKLYEYISNNKKEVERDYQYIVCSKKSFNKCAIRGLKKINLLHSNPSNILQVNWVKELKLPENNLTFEQSYNMIISTIIESLQKDISGKLDFCKLNGGN